MDECANVWPGSPAARRQDVAPLGRKGGPHLPTDVGGWGPTNLFSLSVYFFNQVEVPNLILLESPLMNHP